MSGTWAFIIIAMFLITILTLASDSRLKQLEARIEAIEAVLPKPGGPSP